MYYVGPINVTLHRFTQPMLLVMKHFDREREGVNKLNTVIQKFIITIIIITRKKLTDNIRSGVFTSLSRPSGILLGHQIHYFLLERLLVSDLPTTLNHSTSRYPRERYSVYRGYFRIPTLVCTPGKIFDYLGDPNVVSLTSSLNLVMGPE